MTDETFGEELTDRVRRARSMFCMEYGMYPDTVALSRETIHEACISAYAQMILRHLLRPIATPEDFGEIWGLTIVVSTIPLPLGAMVVSLRGTGLYLGYSPVVSNHQIPGKKVVGDEGG